MRRREGTPLNVLRSALAALVIAMTSTVGAQQPQIIRSTEAPAWGTSLRFVEEIRIGRVDGAEEYVLGDVRQVAVGGDGAIFVADVQVPVIRMYDAQGRFVRTVGRRGAGPGEYDAIGGMRALPDGRLAVWDNRNGRITVFTAAGDLSATHRVASGLSTADVFQVDRGGRSYVRVLTRQPEPGQILHEGWARLSPTGRIVDTIPMPRDPDPSPSFVLPYPFGYERDRPFPTETVSTISALGYLITGRNDQFGFELHRPAAPVLRVERPYVPIRLGRDERTEWEAWARLLERNAMRPPPPMTPRQVSYTIPAMKPAYSALLTDSQGRVWVRRYVEAQSRPGPQRQPGDERPRRVWREPPTFDVFEPTGRFLGTITLPFNASFHDAVDRHIWATVRGNADEPYVVRLRIEPAAR